MPFTQPIYYIISHHITSHHITSYRIVSYRIVSYRIVSYHIISYHIISYHIISYHITSHHITSHHITSHHITSHHITSYHIISYYIILYYIILYYIILIQAYSFLKQRSRRINSNKIMLYAKVLSTVISYRSLLCAWQSVKCKQFRQIHSTGCPTQHCSIEINSKCVFLYSYIAPFIIQWLSHCFLEKKKIPLTEKINT